MCKSIDYCFLIALFLSFVHQRCAASYAFRGPTNVISKRGDRVTLSCYTNNPKAIMRWSRSNSVDDDTGDIIYSGKRIRDDLVDRYQVMDDKNGTVTLVVLSVDDAVSFICKDASNAHDGGKAFVIIIDESLPTLKRTFPTSDMVEQRCTFKYRGWLEPTVQWIDQSAKVVAISWTDKYNIGESVESVILFPTSSQQEWHYGCRVTFLLNNGSRITFNNSVYIDDELDSGEDEQSLFDKLEHRIILVIVAAAGGVIFIWAVAMTVMYTRLRRRKHPLQNKVDGSVDQQQHQSAVDTKCARPMLGVLKNFVCRLLPAELKRLRDSQCRYDPVQHIDTISTMNT